MNRPVSFVVLFLGIALIIYAVGASHSFGDILDIFLQIFRGVAEQRTTALVCGGMAFAVFGAYGISRRQADKY